MICLGIESTCDETSVGIVKDGTKVLANVVASSSSMHEKYGGIVPEVAAREQLKVMVPVISEALLESGVESRELDAIAVAYGPGLIGSLLIGVETAKSLALAWNKPLIGVNHLVGHLYANWLERTINLKLETGNKKPEFPAIGLVVSGGHTDLVYMESHSRIKWIGGTLDDAAGEVLDKAARVLGLGYPGGPEIERQASQSRKSKVKVNNSLPIPMRGSKSFDFSFSGIKTAVVNMVNRPSLIDNGEDIDISQICYELQERIFQSLVKKTFAAVDKYSAESVVVGGGVSANGRLREMMNIAGEDNRIKVYFPEKKYSTDNGAMVATAAFFKPKTFVLDKLQANPSLQFI